MEHCFTFDKSSFGSFFEVMSEFGQVYAPVKVSDQSFAYKKVSNYEEIAFEALRTILPPKKFTYPQNETLLTYQGTEIVEHKPDTQPQVLFGLHPCDLAGLLIMDKSFGEPPADSHYQTRRQATLIVGLSCMPDKHCFCKSMGTDAPDTGYDIFLTDLGNLFFVQVHTPKAERLVDSRPELFKPALIEHKQTYKEFWLTRDKCFQIGFVSDNLPSIIDMEWDNPVWEELGKRCLSCGNCTPVCPTCYCFDVLDVASLNADSGERVREWDSCQFNGFAQVSGGFNFRPTPTDRLKFWYRHKLHGFHDAHKLPTCVGCGRCTVSCPAGIDDIVSVVLRLQGDGKEASNE